MYFVYIIDSKQLFKMDDPDIMKFYMTFVHFDILLKKYKVNIVMFCRSFSCFITLKINLFNCCIVLYVDRIMVDLYLADNCYSFII